MDTFTFVVGVTKNPTRKQERLCVRPDGQPSKTARQTLCSSRLEARLGTPKMCRFRTPVVMVFSMIHRAGVFG